MIPKYKISTHFDFILIIVIVPLICTGMFLLNETSHTLFMRQMSYAFLGVFVFAVVFFIPFRHMHKWSVLFYLTCLLLLVAVELVGASKLGAKRWLSVGGLSIQPSEPVKIAIILFLAHYIQRNPPPKEGYGWIEFAKISFFILIPFLLVLVEPDLGSSLIILIMGYGMLFIVGVNKKIWISGLVALAIMAPISYKFILKPYQISRIQNLVSGNTSAQVHQSLIAVGSGGLFGKSAEDATQAKLKFLPIATSDFIFSHFAERFGLVGSLILIAAYMFIVIHLLSFCLLDEKDYFMMVIASCIAMLFFVYTTVNISMTIELAPVVGIPLPLFSYGGSSFMTFVILIAIFENAVTFRFVREETIPKSLRRHSKRINV